MAGLTWFGTGWEVRGRLFAHMTAHQILRDARRRANEILIFYQGLKDFACDAESRTMIDNMIAEEGRHISALNRQVDRMQALSSASPYSWSLCAAV